MKGFKILDHGDIEEKLEIYHAQGAQKGVYLGFDNMKDYYSMVKGGVTDWTGYPQSGKTELLLECLFNTSVFYGWKHLLYVPDIGNEIEVMAILIHKYTGLTFDKKYTNHIGINDVWKASGWLLEHFKILRKTNPRATITPVEYWDFAVQCKKEYGIQTASIDSWKDLRHDYAAHGGNYAQYLSNILPYRNLLSEENEIHFHTVIHPKTPRRYEGKIAPPEVDDMEGGAQWNNSGKVIISVHRESQDMTHADIKMLKIKPRIVGKWGMFTLNFDPKLSRYYEIDRTGTGRLYAKKQGTETINTNPF